LRAIQQQPPHHHDDPPRREPRRHAEHADRTPSPRREDRREQRRARKHDEDRRREGYEHEEDFDQRSQASTYREQLKPDKLRFVMSIFTGSDPEAWLNRIAQYFELNETEGHDRVRYAPFNLDGEANVWWQWLSRIYRRRQQVITWTDFERDLLKRFGTSNYHNYNEALARIRQTGNLREYIKEFERLACRVRDWSEDALVGAFIGGMRFDLAAEVRLERPDTMHNAVDVARRREDHLVATRRGLADVRFTDARRVGVIYLSFAL
ncbi:Unknown protein, partial [Striga hermonthica]